MKLKPLILVAVLFVTALLWAKARDPFHRVSFSIHTKIGNTDAVAFLPNRNGPFPVAIFAHGAGWDILRDGKKLRLIAEQGLAAVSFEYDQTNQASFDAQMELLFASLMHRSWAQTNSITWIGESLGAQRMLSYLVRHPENSPQLLVRISGGWVDELKAESINWKSDTKPKTEVLILQGEQDEVFPVEDSRRVAAWFETNGIPVSLRTFSNRAHSFGADQPALFRTAAEFCAAKLTPGTGQPQPPQPVRINVRPTLWWYWIPSALLCLAFLAPKLWPHLLQSFRYGNRPLLAISVILAILAVGYSAIHLGLPQFRASPLIVRWTRSCLVPQKLRDDFDWLMQQPGIETQKTGTLLQHLELADYNRKLVEWKVEDASYRGFVLSPWIIPVAQLSTGSEQLHWRRMLWESFYPRIRHENSPETAADIVVRFLRERVTVSDKALTNQSIPEMWEAGMASPGGFEQLYVAALRSIGIPAKLNERGQTEMNVAGRWVKAPRPMIFSTSSLLQ